MYYVYFDKVLFPIAPEEISTKIEGDNKTITLINQSEVNLIKGMKLTDFSFKLLLPNQKYPFALYKDGYKNAKYYLDKLEQFKALKKPFKFKVIRLNGRKETLFDTSTNVTLESYEIMENTDDGTDVKVSIELKQYKEAGVTTIKVKASKNTNKKTTTKKTTKTTKKKETPTTYVVKKGDTLWLIAKKHLGSGTKWTTIYNDNKSIIESTAKKYGKSGSANGHWIYPGTKLKIKKG